CCHCCIDASRHCLHDTSIDDMSKLLEGLDPFSLPLYVLTYSVKRHNGIVDRVPDYRQYRCNYCQIKFKSSKAVNGNHKESIMYQGYDRRDPEKEFESECNVDNHSN